MKRFTTHNSQLKTQAAQSTLEYAFIVTVVVAALTAMSLYVQRAMQANLKAIENQINAGPVVKNL